MNITLPRDKVQAWKAVVEAAQSYETWSPSMTEELAVVERQMVAALAQPQAETTAEESSVVESQPAPAGEPVAIVTHLEKDEPQIEVTDAGRLRLGKGDRLFTTPQPATQQEPIDMVLHCPKCGKQHIHRLQVALNKAAPEEKIAVTPLSDERIMEVARKHWKLPGRDVIDFVRELLNG